MSNIFTQTSLHFEDFLVVKVLTTKDSPVQQSKILCSPESRLGLAATSALTSSLSSFTAAVHCTMCTLYSMFSFQPNKVRLTLKILF